MTAFHYQLPEANIALFAPERGLTLTLSLTLTLTHTLCEGATRLLACSQDGKIDDRQFRDLGELLPADAHLVFNHSKVFHARLHCARPTAAAQGFEVMFLAPESSDIADDSVAATLEADFAESTWRVMVRRADVVAGDSLVVIDPDSGDASGFMVMVKEVHCEWIEEGENDGIEATVRLSFAASVEEKNDRALPAHAFFTQVHHSNTHPLTLILDLTQLSL